MFTPQDLEDPASTAELTTSELGALRLVRDWMNDFIVEPEPRLGRPGPVCPFVAESIARRALWLAPEPLAGRSVDDLVELVSDYKLLLLTSEPKDADRAILIVFPDMTADRANDDFNDARMGSLNRPAYADDGVVLGHFHGRNDGPAVRNSEFHPFRSPVPFVLLRLAVSGDWVFFLDDEDWFATWAARWGDAGVRALAGELRLTNWRSRFDQGVPRS